MDVVLAAVLVVVLGLLVLAGASVRVVTQYERGVVLRFGRLLGDGAQVAEGLTGGEAPALHQDPGSRSVPSSGL